MKCEVDGQSKRFWLADPEKWMEFHGHEIKVGKYRFAIGPTKAGLLIVEITTGMQVKTLPYNFMTEIMGQTKEGTLDYYTFMIVPWLKNVVEKNDMDTVLKDGQEKVKALNIGDMPPILDFDDILITAAISDVQH